MRIETLDGEQQQQQQEGRVAMVALPLAKNKPHKKSWRRWAAREARDKWR